jgi:uncharacterized protein (DUF1697 family)
MAASIVLLRGINLGSTNRIAMPALRSELAGAGFEDVRTYQQSGNIVLEATTDEEQLSEAVRGLIASKFGLEVGVLTRDTEELGRVVAENPFPDLAAQEPKRFQVTFLRGEIGAGLGSTLQDLAAPAERVEVGVREIYAWHPDGVARSKLWAKLGAKGGLGKAVQATSRNWTTVTTLLEMATSDAP